MTWGTIIVLIVLAVVVSLIIKKMLSDRKQGKHSCGSDCSNCALGEKCNVKRENT